MHMLQGAIELSAQPSVGDDEMIDYNNQLRSGIFEAYSGIFQGFKSNKADLMVPYAAHILQFIENVYQDKDKYVFNPGPLICLLFKAYFILTLILLVIYSIFLNVVGMMW